MIVALVVFAAAASLVMVSGAHAGNRGSLAVVEVNGREVLSITLGRGQPRRSFEIDGWQGPSVIEVEDGRVRMVSSHCRDKLCVGMGWMDSGGRSIVCLPNRVVIRITGKPAGGDVDTVTE